MALISPIDGSSQTGAFALPQTTLTSDDTLVYNPKKKQLLTITNSTGGTLTVTVDGTGGTTVNVPGVGVVDVSAGYAIAVTANSGKAVILGQIREYCKGVVHLTGGAGLKVSLVEF